MDIDLDVHQNIRTYIIHYTLYFGGDMYCRGI